MSIAPSLQAPLAGGWGFNDPLARGSRHRAPWLARLWRLSPLTLLYDTPQGEADALLRDGVLPLTARREIDHCLRTGRAAAAPRVVKAADRVPEIALVFDDWQADDPLAQLSQRLAAALPALPPALPVAEALRASQRAGPVRLLLVLAHVERALFPSTADPAPRQASCDALAQLLAHPDLPIHLLVVVDERADALLAGLRRRLPHFDDHRLSLALRSDSAESVATDDAEFRRSLDALVLRATSLGAVLTDHAGAAPAAETPAPVQRPARRWRQPAAQALPASPAARQPAADAAPALQAPGRRRALALGGSAALTLAAMAGIVVALWPRPEAAPAAATRQAVVAPARATAPSPAPRPASSAAVPAAPAMVADSVGAAGPAAGPPAATAAALPAVVSLMSPATPLPAAPPAALPAPPSAEPPAAELSRVLAGAGLSLDRGEPDAPWAAPLRALRGPARLALTRYDALQAARELRPALALEVLAPLYTEALVVVVRADSPRRSLHELQRARINVGPAGSARALTGGVLWTALFGTALPPRQADAAPAGAALRELAAGRLDAVLLLGAQPVAEPALPGGLRALALDRAHASASEALRRFLPVTLAAGAPGAGTAATPLPALGVMTFIVGAPGASASLPALCQALPALRSAGHPAWQRVRAAASLPTGWPDAMQRCADDASVATAVPINPTRSLR